MRTDAAPVRRRWYAVGWLNVRSARSALTGTFGDQERNSADTSGLRFAPVDAGSEVLPRSPSADMYQWREVARGCAARPESPVWRRWDPVMKSFIPPKGTTTMAARNRRIQNQTLPIRTGDFRFLRFLNAFRIATAAVHRPEHATAGKSAGVCAVVALGIPPSEADVLWPVVNQNWELLYPPDLRSVECQDGLPTNPATVPSPTGGSNVPFARRLAAFWTLEDSGYHRPYVPPTSAYGLSYRDPSAGICAEGSVFIRVHTWESTAIQPVEISGTGTLLSPAARSDEWDGRSPHRPIRRPVLPTGGVA
ncbi:hypothetical protein TNCT_32581 [Trichonephila clavata]|uniref:Uncharacterized protein n=1 Tax=Trichonephila clavata TaxID=2740835 RepID=A0A8X6LKZ0_TRICU|nr:hypothetical protein TNCT_32581 [Trichonephila clavata]